MKCESSQLLESSLALRSGLLLWCWLGRATMRYSNLLGVREGLAHSDCDRIVDTNLKWPFAGHEFRVKNNIECPELSFRTIDQGPHIAWLNGTEIASS